MLITNPYLLTGNPDNENNASLYAPGELGAIYQRGDNQWQQVQLDSGATASANVAPKVGQLMYWKNKLQKIVTNDTKQAVNPAIANSFGNNVAGVLRNAATPGNYVWIMQRGLGIPIVSLGSALTNQQVVSADTSNAGGVVGTNVGSAVNYQILGTATAATASSLTTVDLNIKEWVL